VEESADPDGKSLREDDISVCQAEILKGLNHYCYDHLSQEEQHLYAEVYSVLKTFGSDALLSTQNPEQLKKVFSCVMLDHPEIFYVTG
jgi:hypothetical protein